MGGVGIGDVVCFASAAAAGGGCGDREVNGWGCGHLCRVFVMCD